MLFLLRKIRRKLLTNNKVGTYFLYAIGEIFLVVVGILIAVQIDEWNEQRKAKIKSYGYLVRLNEDIDAILRDVESSISSSKSNFHNSITALEALEGGIIPLTRQKDFDDYFLRYYQFELSIQDANTFNEMLSSGELNIIENRWIRAAFSNLSDTREFIIEVNRANHDATIQAAELFEKHLRFHFENQDTDSVLSVVLYDLEAMKMDPMLINKISKQSKSWYEITGMFERYNLQVLQIKDSIQSELKKFN